MCVYDFFVDCRAFDTNNIIDIHRYLMKKHDIMFGLNKKTFIRLLIRITNISNLANCVFLSNQK